tara:strand:+ start:47 stop:1012 length:966 start_codon:yes stop_codon:yes gene_type:complete
MKLIFFVVIIYNLIFSIFVHAENQKEKISDEKNLKWERIRNNKKNKELIIWKSYKNDESYFFKNNSSSNKETYENNSDYKNKILIENIILHPFKNIERLIAFGGITVNNALIPDIGISQSNINYDLDGNLFFTYKNSITNDFQFELINIGSFNNINLQNRNLDVRNDFLDDNNFNFRIGGKLLITSPYKNELFWTSLRTTIGRNSNTNQDYLYSELMSTFILNNRFAFNINPKYFYSSKNNFSAIGISSFINITDDIQFIPEFNTILNQNYIENNSTIALRYAYQKLKSIDLYYTTSLGTQDIGEILEGDGKFGFRLNFLY